MMGTAMLLATDTEQVNVLPGSTDLPGEQEGPEGVSFAKSFKERVGLSEQESPADGTTGKVWSLKTVASAKETSDAAAMQGVRGKVVAIPEIPLNEGLKSIIAGKIVQLQAVAVAGPQEKVVAGSGVGKAVPPPMAGETTCNTSTAPSTLQVTSLVLPTDDGLDQSVKGLDGERRPVSVLAGPVIQTKGETGGKTNAAAAAKKVESPHERVTRPKTDERPNETGAYAGAIETTPATSSSVESALPAAGRLAESSVGPQGETSKAAQGFGKAVSGVAGASAGAAPAAANSSVREGAASGSRASAIDIETMVTAAEDPVVLPKSGAGLEKIAAASIAGWSDGENKTQSATGLSPAVVHSMVTGSGVSGLTSTAIGPADTVGKLPVGEAGVHAADLPSGSKVQDGTGVAATVSDGISRTLTATPTAFEVGIQNGTHGWLRVRAEMGDGGVVNATVSAASSAGQEMLHRELPSLAAYLQEEKVTVNSVVIHAPLAAGGESRDSAGIDNAGGQTPQRGDEEQQQSFREGAVNGPDEVTIYHSVHEVDEDGSPQLASYANGGSWLSVRA